MAADSFGAGFAAGLREGAFCFFAIPDFFPDDDFTGTCFTFFAGFAIALGPARFFLFGLGAGRRLVTFAEAALTALRGLDAFFTFDLRILTDAGERLLLTLVMRLLIISSWIENDLAQRLAPAHTPGGQPCISTIYR
ncbi:MAG TPA: hypothetical protein VJH03_04865 [Blastocatellia bacterium]|nr:hypothetical protein [Blastocatellia bacterium]